MDRVGAAEHVERVLRNPFEPDPGRAAAEAAVDEHAQRPEQALAALVDGGLLKEARRLAVALATQECVRRGESWLFDGRAVPERLFERLRLPRQTVREIAQAGARCAAAIARLAGTSAAMQRVRATVWRACFGESLYEAIRLRPLIREHNVLILGETGTGKELVAQAIAQADPDPGRMQMVNAAAIPRELLEAELFGVARGAFTGATADREGRILAADGSTLFLDELADLPAELQAKLLRVVEDDRVTPLGSSQARQVDVRYLCATSQPLLAAVERGEFRRDLYERLAGVTITIPPLRERLEDLRPTAVTLMQRSAERVGATAANPGASSAQLTRLVAVQARFLAWLETPEARARPWDGNVRELSSLLRSWILGFEERTPGPAPRSSPPAAVPARFLDAQATLREMEDWYILHVLERVGFRQREAAEILGIDRGTLARRLRQIDPLPGDG